MSEQFNYDHIKITLRMDGKHHTCNAIEALELQLSETRGERDAADDLLQSLELTYRALREERDTLRSELERVGGERDLALRTVDRFAATITSLQAEVKRLNHVMEDDLDDRRDIAAEAKWHERQGDEYGTF
jgi:chromosome segregation ATPase